MTTDLDLSSDALVDSDGGPGFSFSDWMLLSRVGVTDRQVMRAHYQRRIGLSMRDLARLRLGDSAARRDDQRMH
jgi:hypothetical protein